jgi:hypothetical protein
MTRFASEVLYLYDDVQSYGENRNGYARDREPVNLFVDVRQPSGADGWVTGWVRKRTHPLTF